MHFHTRYSYNNNQKTEIKFQAVLLCFFYLRVCCSGVSGGCLLVPAWTVRTGDSCWVQLFPLPSNGRHRLHSSPKIKPWARYSECTLTGDGVEGTVSEAGGIQVTLDITKCPPPPWHQMHTLIYTPISTAPPTVKKKKQFPLKGYYRSTL